MTNNRTQIVQIATATPSTQYSQEELISSLEIEGTKGERFFKHPHIESRFLNISKSELNKSAMNQLSHGELQKRFQQSAIDLSEKAIFKILHSQKIRPEEIDYIVCVSSTGFLVPGLSALISRQLNLKKNCQRLDIVGMGCNAGLNGLNAVKNWSESNPNKFALLVCCEICSSIYTIEDSENSYLVNSLFGDGVATALIQTKNQPSNTAFILDFESQLIPESLDCLRFNWNDTQKKYSFYVDKKTPAILAKHIKVQLEDLLNKNQLSQKDIAHWIFHSGGSAILEGIQKELGLSRHDLRHTHTILKKMGNMSSSSFLFSLEHLINEQSTKSGDYGIIATMGPGLTIEMALIRWN